MERGVSPINRPLSPFILGLLLRQPCLPLRLSLKSNFLFLKERPSRARPSLLKREERGLKIPSEENKHINLPSTSKVNSPSQDLIFQREGDA